MAYGLGDQIERHYAHRSHNGESRQSRRFQKRSKHRAERRRAAVNIDCVPAYRKYSGWDY